MARRLLILAALSAVGASSDSAVLPANAGQSAPQSGTLSGAQGGQALRMDRVPFNVLAETMLRRVSDRPFLLCDAALNDQRLVSIRLDAFQLRLSVVQQVLASYGYRLSDRGGVVYVCGEGNRVSAGAAGSVGAGPIYPQGPLALQTGGIGPYSGISGAAGPLGGGGAVEPDRPLGSPLMPAAPIAGASARSVMVPVRSELAGYRPDYVSPSSLLAAVQPVFPDVKFSVVQGEGQRPALFASGPMEDVARFKEMAAYLDRAPDAVEVQALVLEVTDSTRSGFAVSAVLDAVRSGVGLNIDGGTEGPQLTFHSASFDGVLSAVAGKSNVRVVSSPRLRGRAGEKLRLQVGSDVPTLGAVVENATGSTSQSVQYRSSGVIFEVTPSVLGKRIGLQVHQELSAFAETETGVRGSPTLSTRSLDTSLDLESGEWAVVGGLTASEDQVSKQSLLGVLPIGKSKQTRRSELVLLINVRRVAK